MAQTQSLRLARVRRQLAYAVRDVAQDGFLAAKKPVSCFWWDMHPNFGDEFTPFLLPRYGFMPLLRPPDEARFFGVGSIINMSSATTDAVIWGSGVMHADRVSARPNSQVVALRGHLSQQAMNVHGPIALGDPGLLASRWIRRSPRTGVVGLVLHYSHARQDFAHVLRSHLSGSVRFIDPARPLDHVVTAINSCDAILTTSLHGLVVADSYGIPAVWSLPEPVLPGGAFKFDDYESVVEPRRSRRVDIEDMTSTDAIRRAAATVNGAAVRHAVMGLEDSLLSLHAAYTTTAPTASRLWHQYKYLLG